MKTTKGIDLYRFDTYQSDEKSSLHEKTNLRLLLYRISTFHESSLDIEQIIKGKCISVGNMEPTPLVQSCYLIVRSYIPHQNLLLHEKNAPYEGIALPQQYVSVHA